MRGRVRITPGGANRIRALPEWAHEIAHQLEIPVSIYPFCFFPICISSLQCGQIREKSTDKDYFQWSAERIKNEIS